VADSRIGRMPWPGFEPGCLAALPPQSGGNGLESSAIMVNRSASSRLRSGRLSPSVACDVMEAKSRGPKGGPTPSAITQPRLVFVHKLMTCQQDPVTHTRHAGLRGLLHAPPTRTLRATWTARGAAQSRHSEPRCIDVTRSCNWTANSQSSADRETLSLATCRSIIMHHRQIRGTVVARARSCRWLCADLGSTHSPPVPTLGELRRVPCPNSYLRRYEGPIVRRDSVPHSDELGLDGLWLSGLPRNRMPWHIPIHSARKTDAPQDVPSPPTQICTRSGM